MWFTIFLHQILFTALCLSQSTDSSVITPVVTDPLKNRLFLMPTGQIMDEGRFSITNIDILLLHLSYSPLSYLQLDATGLAYPAFYEKDKDINASFGVKLQIVKPTGFLKGIALGVDVGYFGQQRQHYCWYDDAPPFTYYEGVFDDLIPTGFLRTSPFVTSTIIATSFECSKLQAHINIGQFFFEHRNDNGEVDNFMPFPSYLQFGIVYDFGNSSNKSHVKLIGEYYITKFHPDEGISTGFILTGFRFYGKNTVIDIAVRVNPASRHYNSDIPPLPYLGFNFFI